VPVSHVSAFKEAGYVSTTILKLTSECQKDVLNKRQHAMVDKHTIIGKHTLTPYDELEIGG